MLALRLRDVDLDSTPARLNLRAETTKTKERRISFITPEAVDAVKAWLTVRDEYIRTAAARVKGLNEAGYAGPKRLDDDRLFPFEDTSYRRDFRLRWCVPGLLIGAKEPGGTCSTPCDQEVFQDSFRGRSRRRCGREAAWP